MEIWGTGNRLVMIMTVAVDFPRDVREPSRVTEWEQLMSSFQQLLPGTPAGEKWITMTRIFALDEQVGAHD